ncbi:heterokaryon incompatibility protein-domain-containing protein [Apodospora peruviana]|uniref:Heterokaryon incompatibility protein-domain-containing protein n=1 Tax=Apodospora peruviana TaxID=516989 RepID=A0AAE0IKH7_9PEZI|nr:heterokaryon incompatibility protein-domain-containing protein [Apodospora peruviana]
MFLICAYEASMRGDELQKAMWNFKQHGLSDDNLPIDRTVFKCLNGKSKKKTWSNTHISKILDNQWKYLVPVLSTTKATHRDLAPSCILPFTMKEQKDDISTSGTFSHVYKCEIHPDYLDNPGRPRLKNQSRNKMVTNWEAEAKTLDEMNQLGKKHIIRFLTAFHRTNKSAGDEDYCLMFEWADGGTLRTLWREYPRPELTPALVKAAVVQLHGLLDALSGAHYPATNGKPYQPDGKNYRHGDLKLENILWFKGQREGEGALGTLKVADWGLAKGHVINTEHRTNKTSAEFGTRRYEPPESETGEGFIVWLMYGPEGLRRFNDSLQTESHQVLPFYQVGTAPHNRRRTVARVHDVVVRWMKHMAKDSACQKGTTALGELLELVKTRLLVVKLPPGPKAPSRSMSEAHILDSGRRPRTPDRPNPDPTPSPSPISELGESVVPKIEVHEPAGQGSSPSPQRDEPTKPISAHWQHETTEPQRGTSDLVKDRMEEILRRCEADVSFCFKQQPNPCSDLLLSETQSRTEDNNGSVGESRAHILPSSTRGSTLSLAVPQKPRTDYGKTRLDDEWDIQADNEFAIKVFSAIEKSSNSRELAFPKTQPSQNLLDYLEGNKASCDLCGLFWRTYEHSGSATKHPNVLFKREGSLLKVNGTSAHTLSIFRSPKLKTQADDQVIRIGFPKLPSEASNESHFEVIRHWLHDCNENHPGCKLADTEPKELPTRVIDVGKTGDDVVYLKETTGPDVDDKGEWLALSHQWGQDRKLHFSTKVDNVDSHIRQGVKMNDLPATFRDAVVATRAMGFRYLWIDLLCIIQGPGGDTSQEVKRMEQVYSGASCVLASVRADNHYAGFLNPRRNSRDSVTLVAKGTDAPFYICETIDDFQGHVLRGPLNKRAWVLQEHALAHRTVFFAEEQTYFEYPNFPDSIKPASLGEKILRYQDLPMAIAGLENRLLSALGCRGEFGIFDDSHRKGLLRRSLLWCRGSDFDSLKPISFQVPSDKPPSWSWMAYEGGVDYIGNGGSFGSVDWEDVESPWSGTNGGVDEVGLVADAKEYDLTLAAAGDKRKIVFDCGEGERSGRTMCVVLGRQQQDLKRRRGRRDQSGLTHYVLIVRPMEGGKELYERVGAGYLPGRCIVPGGRSVRVTIH